MSDLKQLTPDQTDEVIKAAADRGVSVIVTVRHDDRWVVYHTSVAAAEGHLVWIEMPAATDETDPQEVLTGAEVGLCFRLANDLWADYRYFVAGPVVALKEWSDPQGEGVPAFVVRCPKEVHGLWRREYARTTVPPDRVVRASVWPGGGRVTPEERSPRRPMWSGRVTDMSLGGFQMRTHRSGMDFYEPGDLVGACLKFDEDASLLLLDAQFRHGKPDGAMALLGFRFLGLEKDPDSTDALEAIIRRIRESGQD